MWSSVNVPVSELPRCPEVPKDTACLTYLIPGGGSIVGMRWVVFDKKTGKSDLNWR